MIDMAESEEAKGAPHPEKHFLQRVGWLRATVLGANDGIVSTASLVVGVSAAQAATHDVLVAGVAGLVAGAMSMAAGEYVSVSSQTDTEKADIARERREIATDEAFERAELTQIYIDRGLEPSLAAQVADQLMAHDALGAHLRDELGLSEAVSARPIQAALASAAAFSVGGGSAAARHPAVSRRVPDPRRRRILAALPRHPRRRGCGGRRLTPSRRSRQGHLLGSPRHGAHRRCRRFVRCGGLRRPPSTWPANVLCQGGLPPTSCDSAS